MFGYLFAPSKHKKRQTKKGINTAFKHKSKYPNLQASSPHQEETSPYPEQTSKESFYQQKQNRINPQQAQSQFNNSIKIEDKYYQKSPFIAFHRRTNSTSGIQEARYKKQQDICDEKNEQNDTNSNQYDQEQTLNQQSIEDYKDKLSPIKKSNESQAFLQTDMQKEEIALSQTQMENYILNNPDKLQETQLQNNLELEIQMLSPIFSCKSQDQNPILPKSTTARRQDKCLQQKKVKQGMGFLTSKDDKQYIFDEIMEDLSPITQNQQQFNFENFQDIQKSFEEIDIFQIESSKPDVKLKQKALNKDRQIKQKGQSSMLKKASTVRQQAKILATSQEQKTKTIQQKQERLDGNKESVSKNSEFQKKLQRSSLEVDRKQIKQQLEKLQKQIQSQQKFKPNMEVIVETNSASVVAKELKSKSSIKNRVAELNKVTDKMTLMIKKKIEEKPLFENSENTRRLLEKAQQEIQQNKTYYKNKQNSLMLKHENQASQNLKALENDLNSQQQSFRKKLEEKKQLNRSLSINYQLNNSTAQINKELGLQMEQQSFYQKNLYISNSKDNLSFTQNSQKFQRSKTFVNTTLPIDKLEHSQLENLQEDVDMLQQLSLCFQKNILKPKHTKNFSYGDISAGIPHFEFSDMEINQQNQEEAQQALEMLIEKLIQQKVEALQQIIYKYDVQILEYKQSLKESKGQSKIVELVIKKLEESKSSELKLISENLDRKRKAIIRKVVDVLFQK